LPLTYGVVLLTDEAVITHTEVVPF